MSFGDWYAALFSLGAGVAILGFWSGALLLRRLPVPAAGRPDVVTHVVAEFVSAALLIAGGVALLADDGAAWARTLAGVGLGTALYAMIGSPGYYVGKPLLLAALLGGLVFAIPAVALLIAG